MLDPDERFRAALAAVLRSAGYQVEEGGDGRAISTVKVPPQAMVVEMLMPDCDGLEALQAARSRWPAVRVIATTAGSTALTTDYLLGLAAHLGADATLPKGSPLEAYCAALDRLLHAPG